jgi:hypothetical protein
MMPPMRSPLLLLFAVLSLCALSARPAEAAKKKRYYFELAQVKAADTLGKTGAELVGPTTTQVTKSITSHPQLVATLDGAPDPKVDAKGFKKWLTKKKLSGAYRVNVELIAFEEELEDKDESLSKEKRLVIRLSLRTFGETIPERVMAFSGEGSATVKLDVGKKLRPKDRDYAIAQALELAMTDALASSLTKLALPPPKPKK